MSERGTIEPNSKGGWTIKPGVWIEPKAAPQPDARLEMGRIVRVTFDFILSEGGTREEIEERVTDGLNMEFDALGDPILEDLGVCTDRPQLTERALSESVARSASRASPAPHPTGYVRNPKSP